MPEKTQLIFSKGTVQLPPHSLAVVTLTES
jgi:hypothetical protein